MCFLFVLCKNVVLIEQLVGQYDCLDTRRDVLRSDNHCKYIDKLKKKTIHEKVLITMADFPISKKH